ncbi:MAG: iron-sulfur cluster repair di-iron protein [Cyclobacteriaceae bacterium]|nr:iron-sulfur cluster repair di-iron protein [Cyclobacteriaceae bacterium]
MNITDQSIVGELVAQDYRTAWVFKNHGIDFCCNGNCSIAEACERKNVASSVLIEKLQHSVQQNENKSMDYNTWPLDLLADYIEKKHHRYVDAKIQEIKPFLNKVVKVHGSQHPELAEVEQLFNQSAGELAAHMKKEEFILFPFIRKMIKSKDSREPLAQPHFGTVQNPITMMHHEHDTEGERFRRIAALTGSYTPPADACNTYRVTFSLLKEFEEDLHLHIHLENNILFPKAIAMEKEMYAYPEN